MLCELRVRNFVLIEELALRLEPGFNVLTGETGAGKSIVVGALGSVLGDRAAADLVRPGAEEAEIEALFDVSTSPRARAQLAEAGLDQGDEVVLRRVVQAGGRSRAYINGRLCTAAQLSALAAELVDISSQHESVALADAATHLGYLDAFAKLEPDRRRLAIRVDDVLARAREVAQLEGVERTRAEREAFLRFQIASVDEVGPKQGEAEQLAETRQRLRHAGRLRELSTSAAERLYDKDGSLCDELGRLAAELSGAANLDAGLIPLAASLESARAEIVEVARALARYAEGIDSDPARLEQIEDRLFQLGRLLRAHNGDLGEVLAARVRMGEELASLEGSSARLDEQRSALAVSLSQAGRDAEVLSEARKKAAVRLGEAIGKELGALGMGRARVVVEVAPQRQGGTELGVSGARLTRDGIDRVEFLIAPNPGVEPRSLSRIASGGELSRALLAIKRVLADTGPLGLYVFDEVDAGVGGAIAERIGRAIADVARHRQVLCITHLPSIAAFATAHFCVEKGERQGIATTVVRRLEPKERRLEIARMLTGARVTDAARRAADELIEAAAPSRRPEKLARGKKVR
jgi:DNA repair protein RecN (Recombination protein N)